ncbi:helix-turn-helix transcriptional regulator [Kitasatospora sp. RG8]|uniref:LuxR C-terminal-related transcriptional regulator n=1 Tax=Kitasatospora sp. RG8 TaxID=2820815 RepID=UPI001AE09293|nr:LuxR C-terminal-related transcriptional regulator [Kitasatospora sp. RG8]MBP0452321.1 helix-turn-helix transcriptional regulator [Kitasatospora sp. RG8]
MKGGSDRPAQSRAAAGPAGSRDGEPAPVRTHVPGAVRPDEGERVPPGVSAALHTIALANRGENRPLVVRRAERVLAVDEWRADPRCVWPAVLSLLYAGDTASAGAHCARLVRDRLWAGSARHRETLALLRARLGMLSGDADRAARLLRAVLSSGRPETPGLLAAAWLVEALVRTGDLEGAHRVLLEHGLAGPLDAGHPDGADVLAARGALHLAAGRFRHGIDDHLACGRLLAARDVANPAVVAWRSRGALGAVAARRYDLALALGTDELIAARRWGSARGIGTALHAVALSRRDETSPALLEEAVDLLDLAGARGELTQALYDLGTMQAERRDVAGGRSRLAAAGAVARTCRNAFWAHRADSALRMSGPDGAPLTRQEARIAQLARAGYSNRRIAESLSLTVRTVEFHLSGVYRKLSISGRRELLVALGQF